MTDARPTIGDIFGIQPIADAVNKATTGIGSILGRILMPPSEEFGLYLQDHVKNWRSKQAEKIAAKAEELLQQKEHPESLHAPLRLVANVLQQGSLVSDSEVADLWAGLLCSSCTESGDDDSNLIYTNILSALTTLQATLLKYACEAAYKRSTPNGLVMASMLTAPVTQLQEITGETDVQRLDRELDHLHAVGLINGGFMPMLYETADITPTALALHMYVRCQGSRESPAAFYEVN